MRSSVNSLKAIQLKIKDLGHQREEVSRFSIDEFIAIIKDVGFSCTRCGRCCTAEFNDHVFLLDDDAERVKELCSDALVPAPHFELCDQNGNFYVSGYALRWKENGDCIFLEGNRCTIYDQRFRICRIYPYMLHQEYGADGKRDWRQISGLNEHGTYHSEIPDEECRIIAEATIRYEEDFIEKEIAFYKFCLSYFELHNLRPVRKIYDSRMRDFLKGNTIQVFVFHRDHFERHAITKEDYRI